MNISIITKFIREISKSKAFCLFATHFHEITRLSEEISHIKNMHASAIVEDNQLHLLYKIEDGPCDQSFGVHIAKLTNFPTSIIQELNLQKKFLF